MSKDENNIKISGTTIRQGATLPPFTNVYGMSEVVSVYSIGEPVEQGETVTNPKHSPPYVNPPDPMMERMHNVLHKLADKLDLLSELDKRVERLEQGGQPQPQPQPQPDTAEVVCKDILEGLPPDARLALGCRTDSLRKWIDDHQDNEEIYLRLSPIAFALVEAYEIGRGQRLLKDS